MEDKTVYPYGTGGQLPSSIGIINDLTTGGADKALSAEQGKVLGDLLLGGRGTFADAYDKAIENSTHFFPWLLEDVDENGDNITKMIWHVGNKRFIDAIGSEIDGKKNGLNITADADGVLLIKKASEATATELPFINGVTNYGFSEIASIWNDTGSNSDDTYNGKTFNITGMTGEATTLKFDLGGATVNSFELSTLAKATDVIGWNINNARLREYLYNNSGGKLKNVQISGIIAGSGNGADSLSGTYRLFNGSPLERVDFSGLELQAETLNYVTSLEGFLGHSTSNWSLTYVDIRNFDTTYVKNFGALSHRDGLSTLIIGNLNTKAYTSGSFMTHSTYVTLVCTADTPPDISKYNYLTNHVTKIKVPNKTIEVEGEQVSVLELYQAATGWSSFTGTWETYEEGDY